MGYSSTMRSRMGYPHHVRRLGMNRSVRRRNSRLRMSNFGELGDQEGLRALCMVNLLSLALCFIVDGIWFYSMGKFVISERIVKVRVGKGRGRIRGECARPPMPWSCLNMFRDDCFGIITKLNNGKVSRPIDPSQVYILCIPLLQVPYHLSQSNLLIH